MKNIKNPVFTQTILEMVIFVTYNINLKFMIIKSYKT